MREKMKKMLFLMLFLLVLGAASVSAQVRIGGNGQPNTAAVLDLNATDAINNGTKTLALPRVSLASTTDNLGFATLLNGMLVYNTNTSSGAGVYYWDTNKWVKVSDGAFTEVDGVIGNEITDTIAGGGLTRSGSGTATNPFKVGIKTNGIVNSMIADRAVPLSKISTNTGDSGLFLMSNGTSVVASSGFLKKFTDTVSVNARPLTTITTWQLVLDTTITVNLRTGYETQVPATGLQGWDLCYPLRGHHFMSVNPGVNILRVKSGEGNVTGATVLNVRCLRPSL
ncbi:hypothetical protein FACS189451_04400 [Bacteroidia bacterium]|nr:hypothetical protein FACS189446_3620 [Bacteroidia bacterium]GHT61728.1 hypothetical protein FACS189451_04400 [Bacteroidia bacterium]